MGLPSSTCTPHATPVRQHDSRQPAQLDCTTMRSSILAIAGVLPFFSSIVLGNVEKTIFLGPPMASIPPDTPHLDPLGLEHLSPQDAVVRTYVNASFPSVDAPKGTDSWFFLENLMPGQRYEVRVCWLATVKYPHSSASPRSRPALSAQLFELCS